MARQLRSWLPTSTLSRKRAPKASLVVEVLESRVTPSTLPAPDPIDPTRGESNLLRVTQMQADNLHLNALDHFPVPFVVIASAGGAGPTVKNWKAGAPIRIDADSNKNTGQGGHDVQIEVNTDKYTNSSGQIDWKLRLNVNRIGNAPFAQNVDVSIAFPFDAFNPETLPAAPNLVMGFQTRLAGTPGAANYITGVDGGIVPATMQMVLTPHILGGTTHEFEWTMQTTGAANPLAFYAGEFDGNPGKQAINVLGWQAYVQDVPGTIGAEIKVSENAIGSAAVASNMDLHWTASAKSLVAFDYIESENSATAAQYTTQLVADKMPTDERFIMTHDEVAGTLTLDHLSNAPIREMTFLKRRTDGLALTGVAADELAGQDAVPTSADVTLGLAGSAFIDVNANTLDLVLQASQVGGFNNTKQFFEKYDLEYAALHVKNSPDITAKFGGVDTHKDFTLLVTNAGDVAPSTEMVLDDNGRISATNAPQFLHVSEHHVDTAVWNVWSIVDDGTHGTAVARALDVTRKATGQFTGSALYDHEWFGIVTKVEFQTVAPHPTETFLLGGELSAVQPPIPLGAKSPPDPYIAISGHIIDIPFGHSWVELDPPTRAKWRSDEGARFEEICMAGYIGDTNFGTILLDAPSVGEFDFRPEGSIVVVAEDIGGNPDFFTGSASIVYNVGGIPQAVLPWPHDKIHDKYPSYLGDNPPLTEDPRFHTSEDTFFPNTVVKEAIVRLDKVPTVTATWDDRENNTYIDIDTKYTGPHAYLGGIQLSISTKTDLAGTLITCDNVLDLVQPTATPTSKHYAVMTDVAGEQTLKFGIFGVNSFHYWTDDADTTPPDPNADPYPDPSTIHLESELDPSRPFTAANVTVDTNPTATGALGTFFGGDRVLGTLDIAYLPPSLVFESNLDPTFCTKGLFPLPGSAINMKFPNIGNGSTLYMHARDIAPRFCLGFNVTGPVSTLTIESTNLAGTQVVKTGLVELLFQSATADGLDRRMLFADPLRELRMRFDDVPSLQVVWSTASDEQYFNVDTLAPDDSATLFIRENILGGLRMLATTTMTPGEPSLPTYPPLTGGEDHGFQFVDRGTNKWLTGRIVELDEFKLSNLGSTGQFKAHYRGDVSRNLSVLIDAKQGKFFPAYDVLAGLLIAPMPTEFDLTVDLNGRGVSYEASTGISQILLGGSAVAGEWNGTTDARFFALNNQSKTSVNVVMLEMPAKFDYTFDPAGSVHVSAKTETGAQTTAGAVVVRLRDDGTVGLPGTDSLLGVAIRDARLQLDSLRSLDMVWSDDDDRTKFDFNTFENDAVIGGVQLAVSTRFDDLSPFVTASGASEHYVSLYDRDPQDGKGNVKRLAAGVFDLDQVTYVADDKSRITTLHYDTNSKRKLTVTMNSAFDGRFFKTYDLNLAATIDQVPAQWDFRSDFADLVDYTGSDGINAVTLKGTIDDSKFDGTGNGTIVDISLPANPADEPALPSRVYFFHEGRDIQMIGGMANLVANPEETPVDQLIDAQDDGYFADVQVIDGRFDINRNGAANDDDDGRLLGLVVINGRIDLNDDGTIDANDGSIDRGDPPNGKIDPNENKTFGSGVTLWMNGDVASVHIGLTSQQPLGRGIFGSPFRLMDLYAKQIPGELGMNWGDNRTLVETPHGPLGLLQATISTSKDLGQNSTWLEPFRLPGTNQVGAVIGTGDGGSRINYSPFTQDVDARYYSGESPSVFSHLRDLYAGGEILIDSKDHAVAVFQGPNLQIASLQFRGFQRMSFFESGDGGDFLLKVPFQGEVDHPLFVGAMLGDRAVTLNIENVPELLSLNLHTDAPNNQVVFHSNGSVGEIDAYYGRLPMANDGEPAARFVMNDTPTDVVISWNFDFPGGASFAASKKFDLNFLVQAGSSRIIGGLSLKELEMTYGVDILPLTFDEVSIPNPVPFLPDIPVSITLKLLGAHADIDNSWDTPTPPPWLVHDNTGVSGFINLYEFRDLDPNNPVPHPNQYVPLLTYMMKDFRRFSINLSLEVGIFPLILVPFVDGPNISVDGEFSLDLWSNADTNFARTFLFLEYGFVNHPDYIDVSPIHLFPLGNVLDDIILGNPTGLVVTFDGWHGYDDHFDPFGSMTASAAPPVGWTAEPLTEAQLAGVVAEAVERWQRAGIPAERLDELLRVRIEVTDLPDRMLGNNSPGVIRLDATATGWGWFVDRTPADDVEFGLDGLAAGRMDLLTVLMHEMGHLLGFEHHDVDHHGAMAATLQPGVRLLATAQPESTRISLAWTSPSEGEATKSRSAPPPALFDKPQAVVLTNTPTVVGERATEVRSGGPVADYDQRPDDPFLGLDLDPLFVG